MLDVMYLLDEAFEQLKNSIDNKGEKFCIPKNGNTFRISEQEIRCCFIETFVKKAPDGYLYSIETPTIETYRFTKNGVAGIPHKDPKGRRGNIDLVIFKHNSNDENRVAIIEFKANIVDDFKHAKDFCKLKEEPGASLQRFFVEIFVVKDGNERGNLKDKLFANKKGNIGKKTTFIGYGIDVNSLDKSYRLTKDDLKD